MYSNKLSYEDSLLDRDNALNLQELRDNLA